MEISKNIKDSLFGIIINLICFIIAYVISGIFVWKLIKPTTFLKYILFFFIWFLIIFILKWVISIIYKQIRTKPKPEIDKIIDDFYGVNNRANWGGIYGYAYSTQERGIVKAIKTSIAFIEDSLISLKLTFEEYEQGVKDIAEMQAEIDSMGRVITGGSIFERLFCLRRVLKKSK